jgi:hypothetical protein
MNLQGIVAVSGKPGLWRALAQNKTGYIFESLDANKTKLVANLATAKIAALHEITLFGEDEDLKLIDIFEIMKKATNIPDAKADGKLLRTFFREVAPTHDEEKVYASDMKKVISWFQILKDFPFFNEEVEEVKTVEEIIPVTELASVEEVAPVAESEVKVEEKKTTKKATAKTEKPADEVAKISKLAPKAKKAVTKKAADK